MQKRGRHLFTFTTQLGNHVESWKVVLLRKILDIQNIFTLRKNYIDSARETKDESRVSSGVCKAVGQQRSSILFGQYFYTMGKLLPCPKVASYGLRFKMSQNDIALKLLVRSASQENIRCECNADMTTDKLNRHPMCVQCSVASALNCPHADRGKTWDLYFFKQDASCINYWINKMTSRMFKYNDPSIHQLKCSWHSDQTSGRKLNNPAPETSKYERWSHTCRLSDLSYWGFIKP